MRAVIVAAALLIGTAAYAQDSGAAQSTNAAAGGQTVEPSNAAPKRDAHGVPVISAPATAPAGFNQPPGAPAAPASQPAPQEGNAGPLPPCTRHVTDNCTQTYERSHGPAGDAAAATTDTTAAADTDTTTTKTTVHHRRHRRHHK